MGNYAENFYNYLKRKGYDSKYEHAGIYCIKIDDKIVYIGKSSNMLRRVAQHYAGIRMGTEKKYRIIQEAQRQGHPITFDVLYYAKSKGGINRMAEIGEKEGEYIRQYLPILNTQIPKEDDWHNYDTNPIDAKSVLADIL